MTKKSILLFLICWIISVSGSQADSGEVYLPIIQKGGCMAGNEILEITDGTSEGTIDLLQAGVAIGVNEWTPAAPPVLPTMQSSPLTSGSDPSSYKFGNADETIDFKAGSESNSQDDVIEMVQDFRRLLLQGINYHVVDWHNSIVYIRARASCETNIRYAVIKTFVLPEDDFPFGQPFFGSNVMDNMAVSIERGDWLGAVPGVGECQDVGSVQEWQYVDDEWSLSTALPIDAESLLQTENGYIYAGDSGQILRTIDGGAVWAVNTVLPTGLVNAMIQADNGDIWALDAVRLLKSPDNGASWAVNFAPANFTVGDIVQTKAGTLITFALSAAPGVWRSTNNGLTWVETKIPGLFAQPPRQIFHDNGVVWLVGVGSLSLELMRSTDDGLTWSTVFISSAGQIESMVKLTDGSYLIGMGINLVGSPEPEIWRSTDGINWNFHGYPIYGMRGDRQAFLQASDGTLYGCLNITGINTSTDNGLTWIVDKSGASWVAIMEAADNSLFASNVTDIYKKVAQNVNMGMSDSCTNGKVQISNKQNIANLTHIKIDDGGVFTDIFPIAAFPQVLLPAIPVVNDAIYFGIDSSFTISGPFSSLVFDIGTPASSTVSYSMVWEYYNGVGWVPLEVEDGTEISNLVLANIGVNSVHWQNPSDWATVAIDGDTAWWVRARVSALAGVLTPPTQQNRDIFTIVNGYFEVDDADIGGDIPALAEFKILNESDSGGKPVLKVTGTHDGANNSPTLDDSTATFITDGVLLGWFVRNTTDGSVGYITALTEIQITATLIGGTDNDWDTGDAYQIISGPDLWSNRLITGLRSSSRGDNFRAFINISDEQNVPGITVTAGTNATFGNDVTTPTGRRLTYSALAGDTTFVDRAIITMSSSIVRDYYGKFHVFVRGKQHTGSSGEITMRVQLRTGSGGITFTSNEQIFQGNNDWELLDFDAFTIPAGGRTITPSELGDTGEIAIQVKNDSGGAETVYIYDLVLIPTDEWAGDFTDLANTNDSIIGKQNNIKHFLDIDSVRNPKVLGRSLVRLNDSNESISANYEFAANGEVILQANADQRVWVLSAHIGSNSEWISEPWVAWSIQAYKNQRYLTQRGSR